MHFPNKNYDVFWKFISNKLRPIYKSMELISALYLATLRPINIETLGEGKRIGIDGVDAFQWKLESFIENC